MLNTVLFDIVFYFFTVPGIIGSRHAFGKKKRVPLASFGHFCKYPEYPFSKGRSKPFSILITYILFVNSFVYIC